MHFDSLIHLKFTVIYHMVSPLSPSSCVNLCSSLREPNTCLQATLATFPTPFFGLQLSSSDAVSSCSVYWMREEMALG